MNREKHFNELSQIKDYFKEGEHIEKPSWNNFAKVVLKKQNPFPKGVE